MCLKRKTDTKYIDAGMTTLYQFLDTHINKPFKDRCEQWLYNGKQEYTKSGNRKRASYEMVADLVSDTWKAVATNDIIERGFRENGYIEWNGDRAQLHSRLHTTIERRNVPVDVLEEGDRLITEMHNTVNDTVNDIVHDADDAPSDKYDEVLGVEIVDSASHEIDLPSFRARTRVAPMNIIQRTLIRKT